MDDSTSDCEVNPAPLAIACAAFLLGAASLGLLLIGKADAQPASRALVDSSAEAISPPAIGKDITEVDQSKAHDTTFKDMPAQCNPLLCRTAICCNSTCSSAAYFHSGSDCARFGLW